MDSIINHIDFLLMSSINMSITLIALPAIFNGVQINPMNSFQYLLWILMVFGLGKRHTTSKFRAFYPIFMEEQNFSNWGFLIFTLDQSNCTYTIYR
jgi:hypothetical protein